MAAVEVPNRVVPAVRVVVLLVKILGQRPVVRARRVRAITAVPTVPIQAQSVTVLAAVERVQVLP